MEEIYKRQSILGCNISTKHTERDLTERPKREKRERRERPKKET